MHQKGMPSLALLAGIVALSWSLTSVAQTASGAVVDATAPPPAVTAASSPAPAAAPAAAEPEPSPTAHREAETAKAHRG